MITEKFIKLGYGSGLSYADQAISLGLAVGDVIVGKEYYENGWSEAELTLLWIGKQVCVWSQRFRNSRFPDAWKEIGEQANWTLTNREWYRRV